MLRGKSLLAAGKQSPHFHTSFPDIKCSKTFSHKLSEAQQMYFCCERGGYKPYHIICVVLIIVDAYICLFNWLSKCSKKETKPQRHLN